MRLRRGMITTAAAVLTAAITFLAWPRQNDPLYQGRTLSQWLDTYETARWTRPGQAQVAASAVRRIGTNALPWLLACVDRTTPPPVRDVLDWYYVHIGKPPNTTYYHNNGAVGTPDIHAELALTGFDILGSQARDAVGELARRMKTDRTRHDAIALALIGEEGVPPLLAALSDPRPAKKCEAAMALLIVRDFGIYTNATAAALLNTLKDPNGDVAGCAAYTLGRRQLAPELAVPALIDSLSRPHHMYRSRAVTALGGYKGAARAAIPALTAIANEPGGFLRFQVTNALESIASDTNQPGQKN